MNNPKLLKVLIHHPDGSKSRHSNIFLHEEGFLCKWRAEAHGLVRTNWTKKGDSLVLEVEPEEVRHVWEPMVCQGKAKADGIDLGTLYNRLDTCRTKKDFSGILQDGSLRPYFYTPGDNGHGYRVEVLEEVEEPVRA